MPFLDSMKDSCYSHDVCCSGHRGKVPPFGVDWRMLRRFEQMAELEEVDTQSALLDFDFPECAAGGGHCCGVQALASIPEHRHLSSVATCVLGSFR